MNTDSAVQLRAPTPFHPGERAVQVRAGVRDDADALGGMIRSQMPPQHRAFYAQLPFLALGAADAHGDMWATLATGPAGFLSTPDEETLRIGARLLPTDPLYDALQVGSELGALGIEMPTRRRNRVNGTIVDIDNESMTMSVTQSFGNCPRYIWKRQLTPRDAADAGSASIIAMQGQALDAAGMAFVSRADTFFVATHFASPEAGNGGADVSHRGGQPGFVRVDDARTLYWPEFNGNKLYNTLGNLAANPHAGLLFVDWAEGAMLHLTGRAQIVWDDLADKTFAGAELFVRFTIDRVRRVEHALPYRADAGVMSPAAAATGVWARP
jgi:predicted pyridoxine 5'-phosphate oxidase superfamily flavin-nucleotide-binding protein